MISVIIPVYNVKAYLAEAVESVIHQSYRDLEIILVDDGSTDGSGEICDEYAKKDNRIKVIHQQNKGLSAARNAGLDACQGEIISFLDSDDVFYKDMLEKMYAAMEKTGADIVECKVIRGKKLRHTSADKLFESQRRSHKETGELSAFGTQEALLRQLTGESATFVWNKIYKRDIWEQLRFREGHNYEDLDIILPLMSKAQTVCQIDESLAIRRIRKGSITQTNTEKNVVDRYEAYQHYLSFIEANIPNSFNQQDKHAAFLREYPVLLRIYFCCVALDKTVREKYADKIKKAIIRSLQEMNVRECRLKVRIGTICVFSLPHAVNGMIYRLVLRLSTFCHL